MREIKFRGRDIETGKLVFGSLVEYEGGKYRFWINPLEGDRNYPVDPESVAQLIGVDRNGAEIFEGDTVIRIGGDEDFDEEKAFPMTATFEDYAPIRDGEIIKFEIVGRVND